MLSRNLMLFSLLVPGLVQANACKPVTYSRGDVLEINVSQTKNARVTLPEPIASVAVTQPEGFFALWSQNAPAELGSIPPNMILIAAGTKFNDIEETTINAFGAEGTAYTILVKKAAKHVLCYDVIDSATRGGPGLGIPRPPVTTSQATVSPTGGKPGLPYREWLKSLHTGWGPVGGPIESILDDGRFTYIRFKGEQLPVTAELDGKRTVLDTDYDAAERLLTIRAVQPVLYIKNGNDEIKVTR